jgi:hypothetical protein
VVEFQRHEGTDTEPPTVMTSDRYCGRAERASRGRLAVRGPLVWCWVEMVM